MKLARPDENVGAVAIKLTCNGPGDIDKAASKIALKGERLPEAALKMTGL